ncbi:MAG: DNA cytosine methyltransferase [Bacteroidales bacterium]|jgi:DNA (cytosine-5)-methyltransferase 1|nr:DNA cytosine methyltransferase [Bacteroidales bacterium]
MAHGKVIDLFAGCGGFSSGFIEAGFKIIKAVEFDKEIAKTYQMNHQDTQMLVEDIKNIDNAEFFAKGESDIIIGGPPCQGFSMAGARIRNGFVDDPRNYLFKHYLNIVKIVLPKIFIIENVKGILTMEKGEIINQIIKAFDNNEDFNGSRYYITPCVLKAKEYGIPQARERVVIIGVKDRCVDLDNIFDDAKRCILRTMPTFFNNVTILDAISNLTQPTENGEIVNPHPVTQYQEFLSSSDLVYLSNHKATKHNKKAKERMRKIKNGENWTVLDEPITSIHSGSYGRLSAEGIAPTITTRFDTPSGGQFTHPIENRTITPREAARIQSFKDNFIFYGNKTSICKQIGNAVPPKVAYFLAEVAKVILEQKDNNDEPDFRE